MPSDRKHHKDPPANSPPIDHVPVNYTRRGLKRGAIAAATFGLFVWCAIVVPVAIALGMAAIGLWVITENGRDWLKRKRADA